MQTIGKLIWKGRRLAAVGKMEGIGKLASRLCYCIVIYMVASSLPCRLRDPFMYMYTKAPTGQVANMQLSFEKENL